MIPGAKDDIVEISSDLIIRTLSTHPKEEVDRRIEVLDEEDMYEE